ncbi:MAG: hypothetical protein ACLPY3_20750 [Solirubrobacteraceae bacterium]
MGSRLSTPFTGSDRSRAALARDAALARVRRTRRRVIVGAAGLTAGIAALVASVAPGRTLSAKSSSARAGTSTVASTGGAGSVVPSMPAPASASELGLQGPNQAPSPAPQQTQPSPSQSDPQPSQPQSDPQPTQPQSAPQPSGGGGGVVSGGS